MNGIYWGLTALALMGHTDALPKDDLLAWVMSCWDAQIGPPWTSGLHNVSVLTA